MHCEYCNISFTEVSELRRHVLSASHMREKRSYELVKEKFISRKRQSVIHPRTFFELCKLLDLHSPKDVEALDGMGFFKITTIYQSNLVRDLLSVLLQSASDYHISALPNDLIEPLMKQIKVEASRGGQSR